MVRIDGLIQSGVNVITLLALFDEGHVYYDWELAGIFAGLGSPMFACTRISSPS